MTGRFVVFENISETFFFGERITLGVHNKSNCVQMLYPNIQKTIPLPLLAGGAGTGHRARAELSSMFSCFLKVQCYSYIDAK